MIKTFSICSLALGVGATLLLSGCQTIPYTGQARDVKRRPGAGGTVAVPINPQQVDRERASEHMTTNCGAGNFKVTSEEEVATGQMVESDAYNSAQPYRPAHAGGLVLGPPVYADGMDSHVTSRVVQTKEWLISYDCVESAKEPTSTKTKSSKPAAK